MHEVAELFRQAETLVEARQFLNICARVMAQEERSFFLVSPHYEDWELEFIRSHPDFRLPLERSPTRYEALANSIRRRDRQITLALFNERLTLNARDILTTLAARSVHRNSYVEIFDPHTNDAIRAKIDRIPEAERLYCENHMHDGCPNLKLQTAIIAAQ